MGPSQTSDVCSSRLPVLNPSGISLIGAQGDDEEVEESDENDNGDIIKVTIPVARRRRRQIGMRIYDCCKLFGPVSDGDSQAHPTPTFIYSWVHNHPDIHVMDDELQPNDLVVVIHTASARLNQGYVNLRFYVQTVLLLHQRKPPLPIRSI